MPVSTRPQHDDDGRKNSFGWRTQYTPSHFNLKRPRLLKMTASSEPLAQLSNLPNADGSATFSNCGYAVTAAVNGPIEAPRRDENPFEALIDVVVRPAAGVGGKDRPFHLNF